MCGFIGLIGVEKASGALSIGLQAIQHRGQDATGIGTVESGRVHLHKELGSVAGVFTAPVLVGLAGRAGIGHVRYPTVGGGSREDAQPFHTRRPGVVMAHNGNVTNLPELEEWLTREALVSADEPVQLDRFLEGALEVDVDAICDGTDVTVAGVL